MMHILDIYVSGYWVTILNQGLLIWEKLQQILKLMYISIIIKIVNQANYTFPLFIVIMIRVPNNNKWDLLLGTKYFEAEGL